MIYLASPYTHRDEEVRIMRAKQACRKTVQMFNEGRFVISPIAHSYPLEEFGLPGTWDFWEKYDTDLLSKCDELIVLTLDGWKESKGVLAEIEIAKELGIPISYEGLN